MTRMPTLLARILPRAATPAAAILVASVLAAPVAAQCVGDPPDVTGSWEWIMSVGGFAGDTRTPATEGYTWQLEFRADGTMTSFLNEEPDFSGPWRIECRECSTPNSWSWCFAEGEPFPFANAITFRLSPRELGFYPVSVLDAYGHSFVQRGPVVPRASGTLGRIKSLYR